jgi:hypothetical protein
VSGEQGVTTMRYYDRSWARCGSGVGVSGIFEPGRKRDAARLIATAFVASCGEMQQRGAFDNFDPDEDAESEQ